MGWWPKPQRVHNLRMHSKLDGFLVGPSPLLLLISWGIQKFRVVEIAVTILRIRNKKARKRKQNPSKIFRGNA